MAICKYLHCKNKVPESNREKVFCNSKCKNKHHVTKRRRKLKLLAVEYLGGKCRVCGYGRCVRALVFHHRDPRKKSFGLSAKGVTKAWVTVQKELDKCDLLCSNCHEELHDNEVYNRDGAERVLL